MSDSIKSLILTMAVAVSCATGFGSYSVEAVPELEVGETKDQIRNMMQRWLAAYNNRDIDELISLYDPNIYYANNGSDLERDLGDLKRGYEERFKSPTKTKISFKEEIVNAEANIGYIAGKYRVAIVPVDGSVTYAYGRVLLIFERLNEQSDWKLTVDFDNTSSDISSVDF